MNKTIKFLINQKDNNKRIDIFLSKNIPEYSRSYIKKLFKRNLVYVNGSISNIASKKIKTKDKILIKLLNENISKSIEPYKLKLNKIFEDDDILIIDKPKGLVVHPGAGNTDKTLVNALMYSYRGKLSNINGSSRPGIVHRIDKQTSGLLVVAKNNLAHSNLGVQFNNHTIKRTYQCLIWGVLRPLKGRIETLITRNKKNRQLMSVSEVSGKKAVTNYDTIKVFNVKNVPKISLVKCNLETGRTHQIRVHIKYKGSSILGDKKYGKKNLKFRKIDNSFFEILSKLDGQLLHAQTLEFTHPVKRKWMKFSSKLPNDFKKLLDLLNNLSG